MLKTFLIEELIKNSTECWSTFMRGYKDWLGNILLGEYNIAVKSYLELPPLGLRIYKQSLLRVQQQRSQHMCDTKKIQVFDAKQERRIIEH